ncbi:MAG: hypothetical protein H6Q78_201 [Candidatus Krumholzibacteriota bacterium]|jgi:prolipoprotein diacylglyceryltransferase|nr:hypothetical protein [Candidatus Krumholzibacteriota bacterium]
MNRLASAAVSWIVIVVIMGARAASAQPDLVVQKTDVTVNKSGAGDVTYVGVTVHNNGSAAAGPFTLRVGASRGGASATSDLAVAGLPAGQSIVRTANFTGTTWTCGWGNADLHGTVAEQYETNNCASRNEYWIAMGPGNSHEETIGVVNPSLDTKQVLLTLATPPGWIVTVEPTQMTLAPEELRNALVRFIAPQDFGDQVDAALFCVYIGGTPGWMEWDFHLETPVPVESTTWGAVKALFVE